MNTTYNKILVGLDLTQFDDQLLAYVSRTSRLFKIQHAYFVHVSPGMEIPAYLQQTIPLAEDMPLNEQVRSTMVEEVLSVIPDTPFNLEFDVLEGGVTRQMLQWVKNNQVELAFIGRKDGRESSGLAARRFVRHANCDVMLVTEDASEEIQRIVVATDFSENSDWALRKAIELAHKIGPFAEILLLHIFEIPPTWHNQVGRTQEQFDALVRANLEDYLEKYLSTVNTKGVNITPILIERGDAALASEIVTFAENAEADLIMLGAKGHTDLDAFLLGSVTEKIINQDEHIPLLVVKKPWESPRPSILNHEKMTVPGQI